MGLQHRDLVRVAAVGRRALVAVAVLTFGCGVLSGPSLALAQSAEPEPCPEAPGAYGGSDDVVAEIRAMRVDLAQACAAQLDASERGADKLHDDLTGLDALLSGTVDVQLASGPGVEGGARLLTTSDDAGDDVENPAYVTVTNPSEASDLEPVAARVEDSGEAIRATLWFLGGLLTVLVAASVLVREFRA